MKKGERPDGSFGLVLSRHLRSLGYDTNRFPTYDHHFEDGRIVTAKAYPNELIGLIKNYFLDVWLPEYAPKYFTKRDKQALPALATSVPLLIGDSIHFNQDVQKTMF